MDFLRKITPLFTAGIFFIAFLSFLLVGFNSMLAPIKQDISRIEKDISRIERKLDQLLSDKYSKVGE